MDAVWRPDVRTLEWGLNTIDEPGIGDAIIEQLSQRAPSISAIDRTLLGEAAVESVLFTLISTAEADASNGTIPLMGKPDQ